MLETPDRALLDADGAVLLGAGFGGGEGLLFAAPRAQIVAWEAAEVAGALAEADAVLKAGGHAAGWLAYEAGAALAGEAPPGRGRQPLVWLGVYDAPRRLGPAAYEALLEGAGETPAAAGPAVLAESRAAYRECVGRVRAHIREGDVYQVNYTLRLRFEAEGDPAAWFRRLRRRQRAPYEAFVRQGGAAVLSFSPELFFRAEGGLLTARPMKGTSPRGADAAEDARLARRLAADPKSQAENLMIVDLLRNDLSRVCLPGSVETPALYTVEPYETLFQMTSTVRGRLAPGVRPSEVMGALFPCGSVTGAPKRRAMQIIRTLEPEPRGVYCGAVGYWAPDGRAVFNVGIRTLAWRAGRFEMGVGSGIVWDSDAESEYAECLLKARFVTEALAPPLA